MTDVVQSDPSGVSGNWGQTFTVDAATGGASTRIDAPLASGEQAPRLWTVYVRPQGAPASHPVYASVDDRLNGRTNLQLFMSAGDGGEGFLVHRYTARGFVATVTTPRVGLVVSQPASTMDAGNPNPNLAVRFWIAPGAPVVAWRAFAGRTIGAAGSLTLAPLNFCTGRILVASDSTSMSFFANDAVGDVATLFAAVNMSLRPEGMQLQIPPGCPNIRFLNNDGAARNLVIYQEMWG